MLTSHKRTFSRSPVVQTPMVETFSCPLVSLLVFLQRHDLLSQPDSKWSEWHKALVLEALSHPCMQTLICMRWPFLGPSGRDMTFHQLIVWQRHDLLPQPDSTSAKWPFLGPNGRGILSPIGLMVETEDSQCAQTSKDQIMSSQD